MPITKFQETMDSMPLTIPASMEHLEDEFRKILLSVKFAAESEIVAPATAIVTNSEYWEAKSNQIEDATVHDLRRVTGLMIAAGYSQERVLDVYTSVRKTRLDAICQNLDWHIDEDTCITSWIHAAKITVAVVFPCERRLFSQIFQGSITDQNIEDARFVEIVEHPALRLMRFMESVISHTEVPMYVFQVLDLYEFLSSVLPVIRTTFGSRSGEGIISQAEKTLFTLSDSIRRTIPKLDKLALQDKSRIPLPDGRVHPFVRYMMYFTRYLAEYEQTITKIMVSNPSPSTSTRATELEIESAPPLELQFLQIIVNLKSNLQV